MGEVANLGLAWGECSGTVEVRSKPGYRNGSLRPTRLLRSCDHFVVFGNFCVLGSAGWTCIA